MPKKGLNLPKQKIIVAPANIVKRFLAFLIDLIIISFIIYPFENIIRKIIPETSTYKDIFLLLNDSSYFGILVTISIFISIVAMLYFSILEFKFAQTIGKMIANIYVVSETKKLLYWQCLIRNVFLLPFIPFILLWIIDPLYLIYTKGNKRFSDLMVKTKVVEYYKM